MSVKFVSKQSNYMVVLRPGVEGIRSLGTHTIPGLYIKFQAGVVELKEESHIKMMREHDSFNVDYIEIESKEIDPYIENRTEVEPDHVISVIKHGQVEKKMSTSRNVKLDPKIKKIIEQEALKMIPSILKKNPEILKNIIVNLAKDIKEKEGNEAKKETETKNTTSKKKE